MQGTYHFFHSFFNRRSVANWKEIRIKEIKEICCPITHELPKSPCITSNGVVFDRSALEDWLKHRAICPVTTKPLKQSEIHLFDEIKDSLTLAQEKLNKEEGAFRVSMER